LSYGNAVALQAGKSLRMFRLHWLRLFSFLWYSNSKKRGIVMRDRQGLIVYVHHLKQAKSLRKYGHVHFISRRLKYAVLYMDQEVIESTKNKLSKLPYVKQVLESQRPFLKTEYENAKPDKAKEYDHKIGL
jgi:uncharacterized protein YlbG (UPF0298 family)